MEVYSENEAYVFISYSHKDRNKMLPFVEELQKYCNVWYDTGIYAGNEWADKIADRLSNCALFIFLLSSNSVLSENCKDEISMMKDHNKPFITVRLDESELTGGLELRFKRYQYFDLFRFESVEDGVKALFGFQTFTSIPDKRNYIDILIERFGKNADCAGTITSTTNTVGSLLFFGNYGGNDITWEVREIKDDRAILVSKYILDVMPYDRMQRSYANSEIQAWLNTEFLFGAFTEEENSRLTEIGENTGMKVSLLSKEQAMSLFKDNTDRVKTGTKCAIEKGLIANSSGMGWWWLSDSTTPNRFYRVYSNGRIGFDNDADNAKIGIVPCICLSLDGREENE